jgi:hypothetical protein
MDAFTEFEDAAWQNRNYSTFVGTGYVYATVAGMSGGSRTPHLQFFHQQRNTRKRISKDQAKHLIENSEDWNKRRSLRRDVEACELAERMAEKFAQSDMGYQDGVSWPFLADSEKDQWRALARWTLDERNLVDATI